MNNNYLVVGIVVLLVLAVGGYFVVFNTPFMTSGSGNSGGVVDANAKSFVFTGKNFKFYMNEVENPELRVKQGDKVRIEFSSTDGFHDWKIDEFNAATQKVNPGTPTSVEFVADKKGTFEYYCSVGQHRAMGMKGNLIVE